MKSFFCLTGCIIFAYLLLTRPQEVILGTMTGGELCIDLLLPSLFPFMALSAFLDVPAQENCLRVLFFQ